MGTSRISRVTRRQFLKETGLTLAAATAAPTDLRALRVAGTGRHQDTENHPMEPLRSRVRQVDRHLRARLGNEERDRRDGRPHPASRVPARAAAEVSAGRATTFRLQRLRRTASLRKFLVDMTKFVDETEKKYGKVGAIGRQIAFDPDDKLGPPFPTISSTSPAFTARTCGTRSA